MATQIKTATVSPGVQKGFVFFNNHARANAAANATLLSSVACLRLFLDKGRTNGCLRQSPRPPGIDPLDSNQDAIELDGPASALRLIPG